MYYSGLPAILNIDLNLMLIISRVTFLLFLHIYLLPTLSWSGTVLLPSDANRKPITSITSVLLPFVSYLLTLPRILAFALHFKQHVMKSLASLSRLIMCGDLSTSLRRFFQLPSYFSVQVNLNEVCPVWITLLPVTPFQYLNQLNGLHETWHERCVTGGY
jgi:hypothetical protein